MWPAIIQAAGRLGGDLVNAIEGNRTARYNARLESDTNKWITEQNIKSARDLTTMQNDYNTEMWNKQNAYNDPSNQAVMYEKAGFNKQAVLGQFSTSAASAQGAAGVMPDLSAGNGGAKKAAFVLPQLGQYVSDFINILDKIEQHKQNKIGTEMARDRATLLSNEATHSYDYFNYRKNHLIQEYFLNGGDYSDGSADKIRKHFLKDLDTKSSLLENQLDMAKAHYSTYKEYGKEMFQQQLNALKDKNWMFQNITKPFESNYGNTFRVLDNVSNVLGSFLSSFLKLPFMKAKK